MALWHIPEHTLSALPATLKYIYHHTPYADDAQLDRPDAVLKAYFGCRMRVTCGHRLGINGR